MPVSAYGQTATTTTTIIVQSTKTVVSRYAGYGDCTPRPHGSRVGYFGPGRAHRRNHWWEPAAKDLAYLGLTREEYAVLLYDAGALPQVLAARESQRPLAGVMAGRLRELKSANRREDATTIVLLGNWLAAREAA